jgi:hypothetical protein
MYFIHKDSILQAFTGHLKSYTVNSYSTRVYLFMIPNSGRDVGIKLVQNVNFKA